MEISAKNNRADFKKVTILCIEFTRNFGAVNNLLSQLEFIKRHYDDRINVVVIGNKNSVLHDIPQRLGIPFYTMDFTEFVDIQHHFFGEMKQYLKTLWHCFWIAVKYNPDLIYCSNYPWSIYGNPLGFLLHKQVIIHLKDVFLLQPKLSRIIMKFNNRTVYIAVSKYVQQLFTKGYNVRGKMVVIHDGIDNHLFTPLTHREIEKKTHTDKKIISMFSRIEWERDVELFIDTASLVTQKFRHVFFEHHGYVKGRFNEEYVNTLKDRAFRLGLGNHFRFVPYFPDRNDVVQAYKKSFLTIITARQFALPNTGIESMMCGTPSIAYRTGGNGEVIDDQKNGSLVPHHSALFFAEEIEKYLNGERDYVSFAQRAIKDSHKKFSGEQQFKKLIEFYLTLE